MALPASGSISMSQVNVELGKAATARATFNDTAVRALAGAPTGAISMAMLRGKSSIIKSTAGNVANLNIFTHFGSPTRAANYEITITDEIWSTGAGSPALTTGTFPAGSTLTIINNSYIRGAGGNGGPWNGAGGAGGTALLVSTPTKVSNNGYIFGGGGGGGGQWGDMRKYNFGNSGGGGAGRVGGQGGGPGRYGSQGGGAGTLTTGGDMLVNIAEFNNIRQISGGAPGQPGISYNMSESPGRGGYSIQGIGNVTWLSGNNTTQVKGAQV